MDAPRRWQVASLATAVASLGLGGALISRPSVEPVPSIDLDRIDAGVEVAVRPLSDLVLQADPAGPAIVMPGGFTTASPVTVSTVDSADDTSDAVRPSTDTRAPATPDPSPTSADSVPSSPTPVSPESPDSVGSPDSVDSPD